MRPPTRYYIPRADGAKQKPRGMGEGMAEFGRRQVDGVDFADVWTVWT